MGSDTIYLSYDADSAGSKIGQAILADNPDVLNQFSQQIELGNRIIENWANGLKGIRYSSGGDQGVFAIPAVPLEDIEILRTDYAFATGLTVSIGIGRSLSESGKSLLVAKFRGKNQTVVYDPSVDAEIAQCQAKVQQGTASFEEQKLSQAYLQPQGVEKMEDNSILLAGSETPPMNQTVSNEHDCPYCQELNSQDIHDENCPYCQQMAHDPNAEGHADDCPYCAVMNHDPSAEGHANDCPYCQEIASHNPMAEGHEADCPYCARSGEDASGDDQTVSLSPPSTEILPTTTTSQDFAGQDFLQPDLHKPEAISSVPDGVALQTDMPTNENVKLEELQGKGNEIPQTGETINPENMETVDTIIDEIDALPPNETIPKERMATTDAADLAIGTNMEGNVSRPDSYSQDVPTDLGLGEEPDNDSPDISSVLREGLDNHAENIQRERVIEIVGQALEGFKASKLIIERAKIEAPQLYESSIAMLRAMIEMAKLLGLDREQAAAPSGVVEQPENRVADPDATFGTPENHAGVKPIGGPESAQQDGHPNYANLFPTHPDAGEQKGPEDASNDPKPMGQ